MCGRYTLRAKLNLLLDQFAAEMADQEGVRERYNIAPSQEVLAVRLAEASAKREVVRLKWGLVPSWAKDAQLAQINARAEGVATKPMFRSAGELIVVSCPNVFCCPGLVSFSRW